MSSPAKHSTRPLLLAVFAHPDDETFLAGGTLAKYAHLGWDVFLVCATYGESGQRGEYKALGANEFASVRRAELEAACKVLGIHRPMFLECADRAVAGICWNSAAKQVAHILRRLHPDVVITFGPDGISGHPDHVAMSQIVSSAFWAATVHTFPGQVKRPHPASLYYALRSPSVPEGCKRNETTALPSLTTLIDIAGAGEQKLAAMSCHRSQRHLQPSTEEAKRAVLESPEYFHRAFPPWEDTTVEHGFETISESAAQQPQNNEVEHATTRK